MNSEQKHLRNLRKSINTFSVAFTTLPENCILSTSQRGISALHPPYIWKPSFQNRRVCVAGQKPCDWKLMGKRRKSNGSSATAFSCSKQFSKLSYFTTFVIGQPPIPLFISPSSAILSYPYIYGVLGFNAGMRVEVETSPSFEGSE